MNKQVLKLFGALGVLALATAATSCGGTDDLFGTTCPSGGFKLDAGSYSTTSATIANDTCGFMAADLMTMRSVANNTTGGTCMTTVTSSSGNELGTGAISNNAGALTYAKTETSDACTYDVAISSTVTVTADNTFTLTATYSESNYRTAAGQSNPCTMVNGCSTEYTVMMNKPQ